MIRKKVDELIMKMALLICALLISSRSFAGGERYEFYKGIRQMGMGGAAVATVNDETALLSNPAGLGKLRDYFITVFDPELDVGVLTDQIAGSSASSVTDPQTALNKALPNPDKHLHLRGQVFPSIVIPNFGVGVLGKYVVDSQLDSATNKFTYDYTNDYSLVVGFDLRFFDGVVKIGSNGRYTNRTEVRNSTIAPSSTNLTLSSLASSGVGLSTDTGLILTAPVAYLPTFAAVYRDVGRTSFGLNKGMFMTTATKPADVDGTVDGAVSISPILGRRVRSTWTVELRDALNVANESDVMRRAHAGVEFNFSDAVFLRGGLNQRYWTAGLEVSMMNYQFQAASYGDDIGVDGTPIEDRRYEVKFAFRF